MNLRRAVQEDKKEILKIISSLRLNIQDFVWAEEHFVKEQIDKGEYFVAEIDGQIAGCVSLRKKADNKMYIETLAVSEDFRRQGVGTKLVEFAKDFSREQGVAALRAYSFYEYEIGDFYKRLGFSSLRKHGVYNNHKFYRMEYNNNNNSVPKFWQKPAFAALLIVALAVGIGAYILVGFPSLPFSSSGAVAVVNGEEISREIFEAKVAQAPLDFDERQVLDLIINGLLLLQHAAQKGIDIEQEEEAALQEYIDLVIEEKSITATEKEVSDFYQELASKEQAPELQEIQADIEQYIISQKLQQELLKILAELREKAKIEILI